LGDNGLYSPEDKGISHISFCYDDGTPPPQEAKLEIKKFYDANANGVNDSEAIIPSWQVRVQSNSTGTYDSGTLLTGSADLPLSLDPGSYDVSEDTPVQMNWYRTTQSPVPVSLLDEDNKTVEFGNVCTGAGGGLTIGFWSNPNGKKLYGADDQALLVGLNLVQNTKKGTGIPFDPTGYASYQSWLLKADATNMAYMLSAQLSAMKLNVYNGKVDSNALIYAPGTKSANSAGFATVQEVMDEANAELGLDPTTVAAGPERTYQESLMKALDRANNNQTFVQSSPCAFSFGT
jgi:hypothetical protein